MKEKIASIIIAPLVLLLLPSCSNPINQPASSATLAASTSGTSSATVSQSVVNNGGSIIQSDQGTYYLTDNLSYSTYQSRGSLNSLDAQGNSKKIADIGGTKIWCKGNYFCITSNETNYPTYKVIPSTGESALLFNGTIDCVGADNTLYYSAKKPSGTSTGIYKFSMDSLKTETIIENSYCNFLSQIGNNIYYYTATKDNNVSIYYYDMTTEKSTLLTTVSLDSANADLYSDYSYQVTQLSACGDWLIFSVGAYQGSAGNFSGDMYRMKMDGSSKSKMGFSDVDKFFVQDNWICCAQTSLPSGSKTTYVLHPDLTSKQTVNFYSIITISSDGWVIYNTEAGDIHRSKIDGSSDSLIVSANKLPNYKANGDHYIYSANLVNNELYFYANVWGYASGSSWRDDFIDSSYNRIQLDGTGFQTLAQYKSSYVCS